MKKLFFPLIAGAIVAGIVIWRLTTTPAKTQVVVVYVSEDQVFSEPILRDFERETGIEVRAVYDTEEAFDIGSRVVVMKDGRIEQTGPVEEVREYFRKRSCPDKKVSRER